MTDPDPPWEAVEELPSLVAEQARLGLDPDPAPPVVAPVPEAVRADLEDRRRLLIGAGAALVALAVLFVGVGAVKGAFDPEPSPPLQSRVPGAGAPQP
ncbi:MAG: hypothetical protein R3F59_04385 [Myxococcota bacterium]